MLAGLYFAKKIFFTIISQKKVKNKLISHREWKKKKLNKLWRTQKAFKIHVYHEYSGPEYLPPWYMYVYV